MGLLPDVGHLMSEGGEDQLVGAADETVGIDREFMGRRALCSPSESLWREIAVSSGVALKRDKDIR